MSETSQVVVQSFKQQMIESVVQAGPEGLHADKIHKAFLEYGLSFDDFNNISLLCERERKVVRRGNVYYAI